MDDPTMGEVALNGKAPAASGIVAPPPVNPVLIPVALRERPQWVCWKYITRDGKQTKCPVSPQGGARADSTDPATWASFDDAVMAWKGRGYAGIGYVFAADDPYCGIDLDGCINDAGEIVPSAHEIIDSLNSYTEVSPSGRGVKIFIIGRKPDGAACKSKAIAGFKETEVYDRERFFTMTGQRVPGTPESVHERQGQLNSLCTCLWPPKPPVQLAPRAPGEGFSGDEDDFIRRACSGAGGQLFRSLWGGDISRYADDHSSADLALCNKLAFWTGKDAERMDRLFRASGLMRPKWDEKRGDRTYGQMTIDKAIAGCQSVYSANRAALSGAAGTSATPADFDENGLVRLGQIDPESGRLVLSPKRTLPTAEAYVREFNTHPDGRTLLGYGGLLLQWRGNRYVEVEEEAVKNQLQPWLHEALRYVYDKQAGKMVLVAFESNPTTVRGALDTIRTHVHLPAATSTPTWLRTSPDDPPASEILPCRSASVHIPTGVVIPATPALFNINALEFDYEPDPEPPERWLKFLEQLWGDDLESVQLLQEWFGYALVADTSLQKMLLLVGPKRSGKGTIARIQTKLIGAGNVVGPTTGSLAGTFGLQSLIGKSLAIVSDARFGGDSVSTVVERLLCISGEDTLTIDRKFLGAVSMKLPTRFMFLTNELPRLNDASTALAGRFLVLRLTRTFYGCEDPTLTDQLLEELPGILLWAIEGWKRLKLRGRFVQPASSQDAIQDMEDLASPVGAFIREQCVIGPGHRVNTDDLYAAWSCWCQQEGRQMVSTKQSFGRDLMAAAPGTSRRRSTNQVAFYEGIGLHR